MKLPVVEPWYADGLSFQCTQCGNCCTGGPGYVWISDVEIERFCAALNLDEKTFLKTYCRLVNGNVSLKEFKNNRGEYDCVFLKEIDIEVDGRLGKKRVCTAYDVRPLQCRTWPFWDGLLSSKRAWNAAKKTCPGLDRGHHYARDRIEELRDSPDWPDRPPGST